MPTSSTDSLDTFKSLVWTKLQALEGQGKDFINDEDDLIDGLDAVYNVYSQTLPLGVAAKVALVDQPLRTAMETVFTTLGTRMVVLQKGVWPQLDNAAMVVEYQKALLTDLSQQADEATEEYLHVYPANTVYGEGGNVTYALARSSVVGKDWRIGINVTPATMPAAVAAVLGIMDNNNCVQHIKFSPSGYAGKPDSIILYMKKDDTYDTVRGQVVLAMGAGGITLQPCFNLLWNEFQDGIAEAAEPPSGGASFGMYRSALAFFTYYDLLVSFGRVSQTLFELWLDNIFIDFGIPLGRPHDQRSIIDVPYMTPKLALYADLMALLADGDRAESVYYQLPTI